jgi:hypothetical protein
MHSHVDYSLKCKLERAFCDPLLKWATIDKTIYDKCKGFCVINNIAIDSEFMKICFECAHTHYEYDFHRDHQYVNTSSINFLISVLKLFDVDYEFTEINFLKVLYFICYQLRYNLTTKPFPNYLLNIGNLIATYKTYGMKILPHTFVSMVVNDTKINKKNISKIPRLHKVLFENKLIDFQPDLNFINDIFILIKETKCEFGEDIFIELCKHYNVPKSQELFVLACKRNSNTLFEYVIKDFTIDYTLECFKYACYNANEVILTTYLNQKILPSKDDVFKVCTGSGKDKEKVIQLMINYGLQITDDIYEIIGLTGIKCTQTENISKLKLERLNNFNKLLMGDIPQKQRKQYDDVENAVFVGRGIEHLRNLYLLYNLETIHEFEQKYNIVPDVLCFENSLVNSDHFVFSYVIDNYNFKPNVLAVVRIPDSKRRISLLAKFYPELCTIDYETGVDQSYNVLVQPSKINQNDKDNDCKEQNEDITNEDKLKKVAKKVTKVIKTSPINDEDLVVKPTKSKKKTTEPINYD